MKWFTVHCMRTFCLHCVQDTKPVKYAQTFTYKISLLTALYKSKRMKTFLSLIVVSLLPVIVLGDQCDSRFTYCGSYLLQKGYSNVVPNALYRCNSDGSVTYLNACEGDGSGYCKYNAGGNDYCYDPSIRSTGNALGAGVAP